MSCVNNIVGPYGVGVFDRAVDQELRTGTTSIDLAWTDITWLLYVHQVSWAYCIQAGTQPDCDNDSAETCAPVAQSATTPGIWNPLPLFGDVRADHQLDNVQSRCGPRRKPMQDHYGLIVVVGPTSRFLANPLEAPGHRRPGAGGLEQYLS